MSNNLEIDFEVKNMTEQWTDENRCPVLQIIFLKGKTNEAVPVNIGMFVSLFFWNILHVLWKPVHDENTCDHLIKLIWTLIALLFLQISRLEKCAKGDNYRQRIFASVGSVYVGENAVPPRRDIMQLIVLCGGQVRDHEVFFSVLSTA